MGTVRIQNALMINNGNQVWKTATSGFSATILGTRGPTPGAILCSVNGTAVSLTQLTTMGGWCFIKNLDATRYVEIGVQAANIFTPLLELLPGEFVVVRLSRHLQQEATGTGTYTGSSSFFIRAEGGSALVEVDAFDA